MTIQLLLSEDEIQRLDALSAGRRFTRATWVGGLVRRALAGREPLNSADKVSVASLVKELRRIEAETARSAHMLAHLEATARECLTRLKATQRLHDKVARMADALDAFFRGNDSYWRSLIDDEGRDARK